MFLNDENGDENLHLFAADPADGELRDLTPFGKSRVERVRWSHLVPDKVAIRTNERDPRWFDTLLIDLVTGERTLIWENTQQFGRVGLDWQLKPRYAESDLPVGGIG